MDIFEKAVEVAGCQFISDLKHMPDDLLEVMKQIDFAAYSGTEIKKFMCYLFDNTENL